MSDYSNPTLRAEIETIIETTTDGVTTKELIVLMDRLEQLLADQTRAALQRVMDAGQNPISTVSEGTFGRRVYKYLAESLKPQDGEGK